jgi:hypothetical protein
MAAILLGSRRSDQIRGWLLFKSSYYGVSSAMDDTQALTFKNENHLRQPQKKPPKGTENGGF